MNIQYWFPLRWTGWISLQSKGLLRLKSLLQHHSSKVSILRRSVFTVQLSHPYMTTGKTIALTRWMLVSKVMSLFLNMLSRLVITFLPRSKTLSISQQENNRLGKTRDLFQKIRDTKGTFHAMLGSIKDRNCLDLTEAEDIKKRWQEYTEELYKKDLQTQIIMMMWSLI